MVGADGNRWHVVVGLGSAGSRHLEILRELGVAKLAAVRTRTGPTQRPTPVGVRECATLDEALALMPSLVVIATPTALHAAQAVACLDAGAAVLVEKPLATNLHDAHLVIDAARRNARSLTVGFHLRWHPAYQWLTDAARAGTLGRPLLVRASWGEYLPLWHPGEDYSRGYAARSDLGGGPLLTLSHVIDYTVAMLGSVDAAQTLEARTSGLDLTVPDVAVVTAAHSSGGVSSVELDFVTRPPRHRVELRCEGGSVEWDVLNRTLTLENATESAAPELPDISSVTRESCFVAQLRDALASTVSFDPSLLDHELAVAESIQAAIDGAWISR